MSTPPNVYPLSTARGDAIPLEVAYPKGVIPVSVGAAELVALTLPADRNLVQIVFPWSVQLSLGGAVELANNVYHAGQMILAPGVAFTLILPKNIHIRGLGQATVGVINVFETWTQIQNPTNFNVS